MEQSTKPMRNKENKEIDKGKTRAWEYHQTNQQTINPKQQRNSSIKEHKKQHKNHKQPTKNHTQGEQKHSKRAPRNLSDRSKKQE